MTLCAKFFFGRETSRTERSLSYIAFVIFLFCMEYRHLSGCSANYRPSRICLFFTARCTPCNLSASLLFHDFRLHSRANILHGWINGKHWSVSFTILYLRAISRDEYNIESRRLAAYFKSHPKIIRSAIDETFPRDNFGRWIKLF